MIEDMRYRHTQIGWVVIAVTAALAAVFMLTNRALLAADFGILPLAILLAILLLFGTLTVTLEDGKLRAKFGIGLIGKTILLSDIESFAVVKNHWLMGWGIHCFPGGTLYNVSGLNAIELRMSNGRAYRIGTDQPHALESALRTLIGEGQPHAQGKLLAAQSAKARMLRRIVGSVVAVGLLGLIGFVLCLTILEPKPPQITVTPQALTVKSFVYKIEMPLRDIVTISIEDRLPCVLRRTNGFSAAGVLRGHFEAQGLGEGMLFVDVASPPFLFVRTAHSFVIVGYDNPWKTRALETRLRTARALRP